MPGLIVGNLGFEAELAAGGAQGAEAARLSAAAAARASALATLLRAFARSSADVLWTPAAVDPPRIAPVAGLPMPHLASGGDLESLTASLEGVLAWGESAGIARLRRQVGGARDDARDDAPVESSGGDERRSGLIETLWRLPPAPADVARRANHRAFALDLATDLGCALPGARMIGHMDALRDHLRDGGAAASPDGKWVLKAPWSAAGRDRVVGTWRGAGIDRIALDSDVLGRDAIDRRAGRLLARFGPALFEPWMPRLLDVGCCAVVDVGRVTIVGAHRQIVGATGAFGGIELDREWSGGAPAWLEAAEWDALERTVTAVGERLQRDGFRGPFSLDAWRYRDHRGRARFHPLGEINARMSFGLVARAIVDRVGSEMATMGSLGDGGTGIFRLVVGREEATTVRREMHVADVGEARVDDRRAAAAPAHRIELLRPSSGDASAAWLEVIDPTASPATPPPRPRRASP